MEPHKPKSTLRRAFNRVLHLIARMAPGGLSLRPRLHRLRGVKIGKDVWIGDDVYIDNEHPDAIEIQDGAVLSIRCVLIAHTRGHGHIVIEKNAFIGPSCTILCASGKTLRIGEGAVISTGSIVTNSVSPQAVIAPPASTTVASASVPFGLKTTIAEFVAGLRPARPARTTPTSKPAEEPAPATADV